MKRKTLIKNLKSHRTWVNSITKARAADRNQAKAEDIVCGVLDLLEYIPAGLFDLEAWLDRRVHGRNSARSYLDRVATSYYRDFGKKSIAALLSVAIEILEATSWIDEIPVGNLPVAVRVADTGGIQNQEIRKI